MNHFFLSLLSSVLAVVAISNDCLSQSAIAVDRSFSSKKINEAGDIEGALYADRTRRIRLTASPKGSGEKIEVASSKAKDLYYFEKEHNIVWIKFKAIKTSGLAFTIVPDSTKDDYDFLLFKAEGRSTISKIQKKELRPIRSNIARTRNINFGYTGLRINEKHTHNTSGINAGFSQTIDVKDGEIYFLAIDNVYDNGGGATIEFMYFEEQTIEGTVVDSDNKPVEAEIVWESKNHGAELSRAQSNPSDGMFKITVPYDKDGTDEYTLSIFSEGCLFEEVTYTPVEIEAKSSAPLKVILPKLKKGEKANLKCINFVSNKPVFLKSAYPSLKRLVKLMKRNKDLKVLIVGHTNGCAGGMEFNQELSEARAAETRDYLIGKGINERRITTDGKNCKEMLYPIDSGPRLQALNRRIEVHVTSY